MELDAQQKAAVESPHMNTLVLAGAGSGKTRVLTERVVYLKNSLGASSYKIMCFSFTRKAAEEIKVRLSKRMDDYYKLRIGTMHATALQILKVYGDRIGFYPQTMTVYSPWEEKFLLKETALDLGYATKTTWKVPYKAIGGAMRAYYETGDPPNEDDSYKVANLFNVFVARCKENNACTYGSLLTGLKMILPEISQYLDIDYLLVDEVQDLDPLQWQIIWKIQSLTDCALFCVGDIDQSIYEWRGATPGYVVDVAPSLFQIYKLENNYRSRPAIVRAANTLIENNDVRLERTMRATREEKPARVIIEDEFSTEKLVGVIVSTIKEMGEKPCNLVVLARIHNLLKKATEMLNGKGIKAVHVGSAAKLVDSEHFRRFHSFLKLVINHQDNFAFLLIRDFVGVTGKDYDKLRESSAEKGISHFKQWLRKGGDHPIRTLYRGILLQPDDGSFSDIVDNITNILYQGSTKLTITHLDEISKFVQRYVAERFIKKNSIEAVEEYLDFIATFDLQDEIRDDDAAENTVRLMTIHASKGLEFKNVLVFGCNDGLLPSSRAVNNGEMEAERRLAYVAWTRAEEQLILCILPVVSDPGHGQQLKMMPPSQFIAESGL